MIRVLFVCLGNICRSPMAESVFLQLVREAGLQNQIEVDSAGTGDWHIGQRPHHGTLEILRQNGVAEGSRARQIRADDLRNFEWILVMDKKNLRGVQELGKSCANVHLLLEFAPQFGHAEIPDPYFTGDFALTYRLVRAACEGLLAKIIQANDLAQ